MPTRHRRIQVTEDAELATALRDAAPHLPEGLSRSRQVRNLAILGARQLAGAPRSEDERQALLERLAARFSDPDGLDWEALRNVRRDAWRSFD